MWDFDRVSCHTKHEFFQHYGESRQKMCCSCLQYVHEGAGLQGLLSRRTPPHAETTRVTHSWKVTNLQPRTQDNPGWRTNSQRVATWLSGRHIFRPKQQMTFMQRSKPKKSFLIFQWSSENRFQARISSAASIFQSLGRAGAYLSGPMNMATMGMRLAAASCSMISSLLNSSTSSP